MNTPSKLAPAEGVAADLLKDDLAGQVIDAIEGAGGEARFVGGVVRDGLLGRGPKKPKDIDMASTLPPDQAGGALEAAGLHVVPTGIDHGTVTVCRKGSGAAGTVIELTTLRRDIETDGRHAKVHFGTDWREDARRRDFTINTMSLTRDGTLDDPLGGIADLEAGLVRFVGEAGERIREDYLRILRFFRFYARFGKGGADADAIAAITELAGGLERVSGERIAKETLGIMEADSLSALEAMVDTGVDHMVAPGGFALEGVGALLRVEGLHVPPAFQLGFMLNPGDAEKVAERLRLSKRVTKQMEMGAIDIGDAGVEAYELEAWRRLPWRDDNPLPKDLDGDDLACLYAANAIRHGRGVDSKVVSDLQNWRSPEFPVTGKDLQGKGVPTGKKLGGVLRELEAVWVDSDFKLSAPELMNQLDAILARD